MSINSVKTCVGVVLAGGKSSRMGQDKATLAIKNQTMLSYSQSLLAQSGCDKVLVSGTKHGIKDIVNDLGPLGGIYSIIKQCKAKALLILPVDLPLLTSTELIRLKQVGELSQSACFFNNHYLPLYLPVNAFVEQFFQNEMLSTAKSAKSKGPAVWSLLKQVPHKSITPKNEQHLFNSNTPEQWQQAKQRLDARR